MPPRRRRSSRKRKFLEAAGEVQRQSPLDRQGRSHIPLTFNSHSLTFTHIHLHLTFHIHLHHSHQCHPLIKQVEIQAHVRAHTHTHSSWTWRKCMACRPLDLPIRLRIESAAGWRESGGICTEMNMEMNMERSVEMKMKMKMKMENTLVAHLKRKRILSTVFQVYLGLRSQLQQQQQRNSHHQPLQRSPQQPQQPQRQPQQPQQPATAAAKPNSKLSSNELVLIEHVRKNMFIYVSCKLRFCKRAAACKLNF